MVQLINKNTLKLRVPVSAGLDYNHLSPYIDQVERNYIKKLLGPDLYNRLSYYNNGSGSGTGDLKATVEELLAMVQGAIGNISIWKWLPVGTSNISSAGLLRNETENQKGVYKYQEDKIYDSFKESGFNLLDDSLQFIEDNLADFPEFQSSTYYTTFKNLLLYTCAQFQDGADISQSRLVFLKLKPYIQKVEDFEIIPLLGKEQYDDLLAGIRANDLTEYEDLLLTYLRRATANLALSFGMLALNMNVSDKGTFWEAKEGNQYDGKKQTTPEASLFSAQCMNYQRDGHKYMELARGYLLANIAQFPLYEASTAMNSADGSCFDFANISTNKTGRF
jgi:hypothetical protein